METAAIARVKASLSEYIDCVKSGEETLITDRGKPVAMITPVRDELRDDSRRAELVRRGITCPGKGSVPMEYIDSLPAINVSQDDIMRVMDDERGDVEYQAIV